MTDNAPLALANPPQFQPEYWEKVPRGRMPAVVHNARTKDNFKEIICRLANGQPFKFKRKAEEITQLITPGAPVDIEVVNDELVTGMYLKDVDRWAFRMTNQDLADYTKELSGHVQAQRNAARELMVVQVAAALLTGLAETGLIDDEATGQLADEYIEMSKHLAILAISALETGPQQ
jgi:hypothetical protein